MENVKRIKELEELAGNGYKVFALSDGTEEIEYFNPTTAVQTRAATVIQNNITTYSWRDGTMQNANTHTVGIDAEGKVNRMYMSFAAPDLPLNARVKKAILKVYQTENTLSASAPKLALYKLTENITTGNCTPAYSTMLRDFEKIKEQNGSYYDFDVTSIINDSTSFSLVLKLLDENVDGINNVTLRGASAGENPLKLSITYDKTFGTASGYKTHSHNIGFFGQGSVDLACGNLMLESEDFSWGGNLMPVRIKHFYNSALRDTKYTANLSKKLCTADFSNMTLGKGWRLNLMQSMVESEFAHDDAWHNGYIFIDENGDETYFTQNEESGKYESTNGEMTYDAATRKLSCGSETLLFDASGRLVSITDEYDNTMHIAYTDGKITSVTDGFSRSFEFSYSNNGELESITAPDGTQKKYTYSNGHLSVITFQDNSSAQIIVENDKLTAIILKDKNQNPVYKIVYTYNTAGTRLKTITEYGYENSNWIEGSSSTYTYNAGYSRTILEATEPADTQAGETEPKTTKTTYVFDSEDNVVSEYSYIEGVGTAVSGDGEGINPFENEDSMQTVANLKNLLSGHNFHHDHQDPWTRFYQPEDAISISFNTDEEEAKFGNTSLSVISQNSSYTEKGVSQFLRLEKGEYTLSVYLKTDITQGGAYLKVICGAEVIAQSEKIKNTDGAIVRVALPFEITEYKDYELQLLIDGEGTATFSSAQLERNSFANPYNMLCDGALEYGTSMWTACDEQFVSGGTASAYVFNDESSLRIKGNLDSERYAYQDVMVKSKASTKETFALSGWCWSYGVNARERKGIENVDVSLCAEIVYADEEREIHSAPFTSNLREWQYVTLEFAKEKYKQIDYIRIYCKNNYNAGEAYFDDLSLVRTSIETNLSSSDFPEYPEEIDEEPSETETIKAPAFEEVIDEYGNTLTETTFTDGELGTIYRSFEYENHNDLSCEIDARGKATFYNVDEDTSKNSSVVDRCQNKTEYEYDEKGRTTKVINRDKNNTELANVSYSYDAFDNLSEIVRGDGLKYVLSYNAFHNLQSIGVYGKPEKLISYAYKNGNGRLKEMTYANGDKMTVNYNGIGQMVSEKWYNAENTLTAHYKYAYDKDGNIVRSIDILRLKEYNYYYESGVLSRSAEFDIILDSNELVISKTDVLSIVYKYNNDGQLVYKKISPANAPSYEQFYENKEDGPVVLSNKYEYITDLSHSKTDSFGRKVFDELQTQYGSLSREFSYYAGEKTNTHEIYGRNKSVPTTNLVKEITFSDGRIIEYEYDGEERITKVTDSLEGITEYTYDALGQLETETKNDVLVTSMTYDKYGNISSKNGVVYGYEQTGWKDKLISVGGTPITYDAQGNPTNYLGHNLTWEKGRQLKSFDNITYSYNANGIRTSKNVNGIEHKYILDGTKIIAELSHQLVMQPMYNNEDEICGILHNDVPYYFVKNLQGDVIAITDHTGAVVARYTYDAWGVPTVICINGHSIGNDNPFRYRGYYYDTETSLYYLQSRYYDASIGRFINGDEASFIFDSANIYTYCNNNPIMLIDTNGYASISTLKKESWVAKAVLKYIPSINRTTHKKTIWSTPKWLGAYLELSVGITVQSNANAIIGFEFTKRSFDIGITALSGKISSAISVGASWTESYIASSVVYSLKSEKKVCSINFKLAVKHWLALAVGILCVVVPQLAPIAAYAIKLLCASVRTARPILMVALPKLLGV